MAILCRRGGCDGVREVFNDGVGKCVVVECVYGGDTFLLCNVHAPHAVQDKADFFVGLREVLGERVNVVLNVALSRLDVGKCMVYRPDRGRDELGRLMRDFDLLDVWRVKHGWDRVFSLRQCVQGELKQSRLDLCLCQGGFAMRVRDVFYREVGFSDYDVLFVTVDLSGVERGPGLWVFNGSLLSDGGYCEQLVQLLDWSKGDGLFVEDISLRWDNFKFAVRELSMEYGWWVKRHKWRREVWVRGELRAELGRFEEGGGCG